MSLLEPQICLDSPQRGVGVLGGFSTGHPKMRHFCWFPGVTPLFLGVPALSATPRFGDIWGPHMAPGAPCRARSRFRVRGDPQEPSSGLGGAAPCVIVSPSPTSRRTPLEGGKSWRKRLGGAATERVTLLFAASQKKTPVSPTRLLSPGTQGWPWWPRDTLVACGGFPVAGSAMVGCHWAVPTVTSCPIK